MCSAHSNKVLVARAREQLSLLQRQCEVLWRWVEGHSGSKWNDVADRLAAAGAQEAAPDAPSAPKANPDPPPGGGVARGTPTQPCGHDRGRVRWVTSDHDEADRVLRRARTRFGVLNIRPPAEPIGRVAIQERAAGCMF